MHKKNIIILTITIIITLLFSSCFLQKETADKPKYEPFSKEKANEAAVTYLKEKYGEEYVSVNGHNRRDSIIGGESWYVDEVIKKSQENEKSPREYEVSISDDNKYTILGDTVMFEYYAALYEEFAVPIVAEEMGDIPFELVVSDIINQTNSQYGVQPDAVIPTELDNPKNICSNKDFCFDIFIPKSYGNEAMEEISKNIHERLKDNYYDAYIVILNDDEYAELTSSKDKYWRCRIKQFYIQNKFYEVSD